MPSQSAMPAHSKPPGGDMADQTTLPVVLTVAGSDSSGGAGIQADLKTFTALGVYGASVITALTAQNTRAVTAVRLIEPEFVVEQFTAVATDLKISAIKTGMLGSTAIVAALIDCLKTLQDAGSDTSGGTERAPVPIIVDPVMVATSGDRLLDAQAAALIISDLLPLADLITPNLPEAAELLGQGRASSRKDMQRQVRALYDLGAGVGAVLLKGGHATGHQALDLFYDGDAIIEFSLPWVATPNTHGTGCTLSSAIAAFLAQGFDMQSAIANAKKYVWDALSAGRYQQIGQGNGPVNHLCWQNIKS